jgi:hypothetical protein
MRQASDSRTSPATRIATISPRLIIGVQSSKNPLGRVAWIARLQCSLRIELTVRIWDISPRLLCRQHLLAEHRELHAVFVVITQRRKGYSRHPETLRWVGCLGALVKRHEALVKEMNRRGWCHNSPLPQVKGPTRRPALLLARRRQKELLRAKGCQCRV